MTAALHVDLDGLASNLGAVRSVVAPADLMLVVKDDAYGHGLAPVVRRAWAEGVRWFGAFDTRTGQAVRAELGPDARVFVWIAGSAAEVSLAVAERLDVGIGDAGLLEDVSRAGLAAGAPARVHLKIDTGLHRNGVRPEDWPRFVDRAAALQAVGAIEVVGVWSHIAEASDAEDDAARAVFDRAVEQVAAAGLGPQLRHLAASAAAFARPEFRYDLVRVGAFCYGVRSAHGSDLRGVGLRPIARLEASILSVEAGEAIVDLGALDGLPSSLAGRVSVGTPAGARRLLRIGDVSVVEAWPGAAAGDVVTFFGPGDAGEGAPTDLAEQIDTVGEEILVRLSPLVPRRHRGTDKVSG